MFIVLPPSWLPVRTAFIVLLYLEKNEAGLHELEDSNLNSARSARDQGSQTSQHLAHRLYIIYTSNII